MRTCRISRDQLGVVCNDEKEHRKIAQELYDAIFCALSNTDLATYDSVYITSDVHKESRCTYFISCTATLFLSSLGG
jgi:hypothetical protein